MGNSGIISIKILGDIKKEVIPVASSDEKGGVDEFLEASTTVDNKGNSLEVICSDNNINNTGTECLNEEVIDDITTEVKAENSEEVTTEDVVDAVSIDNNSIGINYSMEQLVDFEFLMSNCYTVDGSTSVDSKDICAEEMINKDLSIDITGDEYKILIYHTHGSETFADSRPGVVEDSIIGVGDELTRILENDYGIKTYHDRTVYDVIDGKLDRNNAYTQSGIGIDKILQEYPSIEVILDIHRDGVRDEVHLMKVIDGKPTAQIMFFNGISRLNDEGELGYLYNPNLSDNLSFSLQMHLKGKSLYGDLMRNIYIGGYCYNLDRKPRASLIEVGAQTNTVEEAKNAMIPLAAILYSVLSGNK